MENLIRSLECLCMMPKYEITHKKLRERAFFYLLLDHNNGECTDCHCQGNNNQNAFLCDDLKNPICQSNFNFFKGIMCLKESLDFCCSEPDLAQMMLGLGVLAKNLTLTE